VIAAIAARAALALVALAVVVFLVRRRAGGAAPVPIAVLARASLGPGLGVALVEAGGRRLLVGWGKEGVRLVRDLGSPEVRP
jgi:flagellar protein FliO/FliZ